jgi:uncharacterized protein (DUF1499 family)
MIDNTRVLSMMMITPCPKTPNCVSSVDVDGHFIRPLHFTGSAIDAQYRLLNVLYGMKRVRVVKFEEYCIRAEFKSPVLRFTDDVEFYLEDISKTIHVKSASRVGFADFGANRRRIEMIRKRFEQDETARQH